MKNEHTQGILSVVKSPIKGYIIKDESDIEIGRTAYKEDANLYASAPELLSALKMAYKIFTGYDFPTQPKSEAEKMMYDAIDKAEGK